MGSKLNKLGLIHMIHREIKGRIILIKMTILLRHLLPNRTIIRHRSKIRRIKEVSLQALAHSNPIRIQHPVEGPLTRDMDTIPPLIKLTPFQLTLTTKLFSNSGSQLSGPFLFYPLSPQGTS